MFANSYSNKRVLVTGHTGFKGSWLTAWLLKLGATVAGISKDIPTVPSAFQEMHLEPRISHYMGDVRDLAFATKVIADFQPDFVFHLAAQAIVSSSYEAPLETISNNVMGTATILEVLRLLNLNCTAVIITSDKCYENVEWVWGYRETDRLGGRDIYSGSKGAAEVIFHSYYHSFFTGPDNQVRLGTGRAGNVIGGGDWAKDRIVADCMRSWAGGKPVEIRSPSATRPWQHVLEPLSGYLLLGADLSRDAKLLGESFNFGPRAEQNHTVLQLLSDLASYWSIGKDDAYRVTADIPFHEAGLLKLNCDKSLAALKWEATLDYADCVRLVSEWYYRYYRKNGADMQAMTMEQINYYEERARARSLAWTR